MFSILIPSWNNLEYLKLCVNSVRQHTKAVYEILVHVNDGSDGTLDWVREQGIRYTHSAKNQGICLTVNRLAGVARHNWLVYLNDDMVCCPGWDVAVQRAIAMRTNTLCYLSVSVIEPRATVNPLTVVRDFGDSAERFDAQQLVDSCASLARADLSGCASPVSVLHRDWWHAVGGYSLEFSPGMGSEDDLMMKFYVAGCRDFSVVGDSLVYHFACRSTQRVRRNHGARTFVTKWGLTQGEFRRGYLELTATGRGGFPQSSRLGQIKRVLYGLSGDFPLGDIDAWDQAPGVDPIGQP